MTLQNAVERAMKIIAKYGDELDYVRIVEGEGCWFQVKADGEGYFSVAVESGDLSRHLCLSLGSITANSLLSDKWEVKAIRRVYITADEIENV